MNNNKASKNWGKLLIKREQEDNNQFRQQNNLNFNIVHKNRIDFC